MDFDLAGRVAIVTGASRGLGRAGLIGMSRVLAGELGRFGITANCVAPGRIATPMTDRQPPELVAEAMRDVPAGHVGTPDEIAATVAFLASDGAAYITGSVIDVNGGSFIA